VGRDVSGLVEGKVIVVTGSGGGIGREFALALGAEGARVVVNDIGASVAGEGTDFSPAEKVVAEIKAAGGDAIANFDSVAEPGSAARIVQAALDHYGQIDGVINNAGILRDRVFTKMSADEFDSVIKVHLSGAFYVARAAANYFKDQGSGSYVHLTSTAGLYGNYGQANYMAAKTGITGLSKSIAIEMARYGVRSNCIAPAAWSRMISGVKAESEVQKRNVEMIRTKMAASTIAPIAVFLQSDAAKDVNGQIFYVRGNEIMLFRQFEVARSVHRGEGWTPQSIIDHCIPALTPSMAPPRMAHEITTWDPV
jgi:NAD(P)-dependent dehydrogenase (short-subunit alcohol dehydrogenase family)